MKTPGKIIITFGVAALLTACGPKLKPPRPTELTPSSEQQAMPIEERLELARADMDRGRVGNAAEQYRGILEEQPLNFEANLNLAVALMTMEGVKFENERDYAEARQYFTVARDVKSDDARPHIYLGTLNFKEKDFEGAIDPLSAAVDLDPDNEIVHERLGLAFMQLGKHEQAKSELLRTLEINPDNEAANLTLGKIYEKENQNGPAMKHLEAALEANPNLDMATYLLERVYYNEGLYQEAEVKCKHFLKFYPEDMQSLEILGNIYRRQERTKEMIGVYTMLAELRPDNTTYWSPIIQLYIDTEAYEQAKDVLERSLEQNPYYAYGNIHYGKVLMYYGDRSLGGGSRQEAMRLYYLAKDHLQKARIDDRYEAFAIQLIAQVENRISKASKR